jgi:hypothetical protein
MDMISVPGPIVPVVATIPISPVIMEFVIVYPMICWRNSKDVIGGHHINGLRNKIYPDRTPCSVVNRRPEPKTIVEAIPEASVKINTHCARYQVDLCVKARDDNKVRWRCKG